MEPDRLRHFVLDVFATQSDEIDCETCFVQLDLFVEIALAERDAASTMPLVYAHLQRCPACREEYDALFSALKALSAS
jgi:predicted anti-sigma-YlaC factor YlaD